MKTVSFNIITPSDVTGFVRKAGSKVGGAAVSAKDKVRNKLKRKYVTIKVPAEMFDDLSQLMDEQLQSEGTIFSDEAAEAAMSGDVDAFLNEIRKAHAFGNTLNKRSVASLNGTLYDLADELFRTSTDGSNPRREKRLEQAIDVAERLQADLKAHPSNAGRCAA